MYRVYSSYVQGLFKLWTGFIQVMYGFFPVMYKVYSSYITGYIQVMYKVYSSYVQGLFKLCTG